VTERVAPSVSPPSVSHVHVVPEHAAVHVVPEHFGGGLDVIHSAAAM
jgi:hypothetical protein